MHPCLRNCTVFCSNSLWTENLVKVEEGLFILTEADWTGSGFNVGSDENPIKKNWFAPEELILGEEVIAPVTVDVYLKVIDDETVAIGVGVEPVVALKPGSVLTTLSSTKFGGSMPKTVPL